MKYTVNFSDFSRDILSLICLFAITQTIVRFYQVYFSPLWKSYQKETVVINTEYVFSFMTGGLLCVIAQLLIDKTKLTPARILTAYVVAGVILTAVGIYEPLVNFAGAGATVPLTGFGYSLAKGVEEEVARSGWLGALSGGLSACSAGIAAAIFSGLLAALVRKAVKR